MCDAVIPFRDCQNHLNGRRHREGIRDYEEAGLAIPDLVDDQSQQLTRCDLCKKDIPDHLWNRHCMAPAHRRKEKYAVFKAAVEESQKDKHGVTVAEELLDYGVVELDSLREQPTVEMRMHLSLTEAVSVRLTEARMSSSVGTHAAFRHEK